MDPLFLGFDEVLEIQRDQVSRYGGSVGLRDEGLLLSALAMPQASFGGAYLHAGLFEMAAAYLFHIVMDHPFIDGNKRTGAVAARVFLRLNGWDVPIDPDALYDLVIGVAEGRVAKAEITTTLRAGSVRLP
jgi:death-on-curing protein